MTIANLAMRNDTNSHKWWLNDSNHASSRSPWLQYSLAELERKTTAMLKVIEQDADSFAQRAEMYYKKRPELINMVEDFYRTHRSLVEEYDQLKSETRGSRRRLLSLTSSLSVDFDRGNRSTMSMMNNHHQACDCKSTMSKMSDEHHHHHQAFDCKSTTSDSTGDHHQAYDCKSTMSGMYDHLEASFDCKSTMSGMDDHGEASFDCKSTTTSHSDIYDHHHHEDSAAESEVDDPELEEEEIVADAGELLDEEQQNSFEKATEEMKREYEARIASQKEEMKTLKEEAEELKEENRIQKEELWQKDEEKREVIRQLSLGMEMLRSENMELRKKQQQQQSSPVQRRSPFEFGKLKDTIFTKLFHGSPTPKVIIAAPSQI